MSNLTWGEFKKIVDETEGVNDDVEVSWIDVGAMWEDGPTAHVDEHNQLTVGD